MYEDELEDLKEVLDEVLRAAYMGFGAIYPSLKYDLRGAEEFYHHVKKFREVYKMLERGAVLSSKIATVLALDSLLEILVFVVDYAAMNNIPLLFDGRELIKKATQILRDTAKNRPRKRGLPPGVCASPRKSLSAEPRSSPSRVLNFEPASRGSRRQVPAYIKVEDGSLLERFGKNLKELEEEAKRIVVKHPALFGNFQLSDTDTRVVKHPDGSLEVISQHNESLL